MYVHIPVLFHETLEGLNIKEDGIYFDGTLGGGGHSEGILNKLTTGKLIACDKDSAAIENAKERMKAYSDKLVIIKDDYKNIFEHLDNMGIEKLDGVLIDMGVSSYQIDTAERGFSYMQEARLDMRMDTNQRLSAFEVVNEYSERELTDILFIYGEERYARKIASKIINQRKQSPIETTTQLAKLVESCYPPKERFKYGNPAKRTFQAIRIEVNAELDDLKNYVMNIARRLKKGGRICVITFHSLEDRQVKMAFRELEADCICDKNIPVCVCGKKKEGIIITKKPISGEIEKETNKRAESAKLRILERV